MRRSTIMRVALRWAREPDPARRDQGTARTASLSGREGRGQCGLRSAVSVAVKAMPCATLAAVALAACGSTTTRTIEKTVTTNAPANSSSTTAVTTPAAAATAPKVALAKPGGCLTTLTPKPRICLLGAAKLHAVPWADTLRLRTLAADLTDVTREGTVSDGSGISATAQGMYLVFALSVHNATYSPETFDDSQDQTLLFADGRVFTEAFKAENQSDQQSFLSNDTTPIQAGESATGDVIFDVPASIAALVVDHKKGALFVGNFGADITPGAPSGTGMFDLERAA
jgi:hypothetical protein